MGVRANLRIRVKSVHFGDPIQSLLMGFSSPESSNKFKRKHLKNTAGKAWFDLPAQTITPEIERDLCLLKLRSAIDLKRHYKKGDSKPKKLLKSGMVIVSTSYFFPVRLMRKERKGTIAAELLSDHTLADYSKKKKKVQSHCVPYGFISSTYAKELKKNKDCSGKGMLVRVLKQLHTVGFQLMLLASSASRSSTFSSSSVNLPEILSVLSIWRQELRGNKKDREQRSGKWETTFHM